MQLVSLYPFDPTGRATANRIENQSITVTPPTQITDYSYVVPRGAPFYADSLVVKDGRNVGARTLVENVDYWCVIDFLSASTALTKRVCVGIALLDPGYSGTLYITYQAVGGNYSLADYSVLEELIRERYVVKHVSYEQVINLPEGFAPEWHAHEVADMIGMGQVVTMLDNIKVAINGRQGSYGQLNTQISNHVGSSAAHTPSQVGLSNVKNYDVATLAEATSGAGNKYVVASIMKQYVSSQMQDLSGFITTVTANATFATKAMLNSYSTTSQADGKYALKSDVYTKAQVNALIEGIDVSSSLSGYYTKAQSDGKYLLKTDISAYIKETVADGRYATKASMTSYSTTSQADGKYATKTASYTKSESEGRYALKTDLNRFLDLPAAESRFAMINDLQRYYTKIESNRSRIIGSTFTTRGDEYTLQVSERLPDNSMNFVNMDVNLVNHVKKSEIYTKLEIDDKIAASSTKPVTTTDYAFFETIIPYRNYKLTVEWRIYRQGNMYFFNYSCTQPFYYDEPTMMTITTGPSPWNVARGTVADISVFIFGWNQTPSTNSVYVDYWFRLYSGSQAKVNPNTGAVSIVVSQSGAAGGSSTMYTDRGFSGSFILIPGNTTAPTGLNRFFQPGWTFTPIR